MHQPQPNGSHEELIGHLTALLFVADQPLELRALTRVLGTRMPVLEQAVNALAANPPSGLVLLRHNDALQLATAPASAGFVQRLRGQAEAQKLSRAALEVLAVVAYRQPATRAEIEAVRGVNSDHALDTLLARGLVEEVGRKETVGRPVLFGTTLEFLQLAGLGSLAELPPIEPS